MAATLEGGKLALSFVPNVEIVTLLCAVYGYIFGFCGVIATFIFVALESLIWGANTWIIAYVVHFGAVALVFTALGKFNVKNRFIITSCAVILTATFGVLSSLVDTGLFTGFYKDFFKRFSIIYVRGAAFYAIQIACNLFLFFLVFPPLVGRIDKICPERFKSAKFKNSTQADGG